MKIHIDNFSNTLKKENLPLDIKQTIESSMRGMQFYMKMLQAIENKITKNVKITNLILDYQT